MNGCPSELVLERVAAGDLPASDPAHAHVQGCDACTAKLAAWAREDAAYRLSSEARGARQVLERVTARSRRPWWGTWRTVVPAALAIAVSVLLFTRVPLQGPAWISKGTPKLALFVGEREDARPWDGRELTAQDHLQLGWTSSKPKYLAIFLEMGGAFARVYPHDPQPALIQAGKLVAIGPSITLDTPHGAVLTVAYAEAPFDLAPLSSAAALQALAKQGGVKTTSVTLK